MHRNALLPLTLGLLALSAGCVGYRPYRGHDLTVVARSVAEEVERIRNQPLRSVVLVEEVERADLEAFVREHFERGGGREQLVRESRALSRLGLYERGGDTVAQMEAALLSYLVGFYDPERARLGLVRSAIERGRLEAAIARELVLAHELTHALQDQRRGLYTMMSEAMAESTDSHLATMAVIEGEAQAIMYGYLLAGSGKTIDDVEGRLGDAISSGIDPLALRAGLDRADAMDSPVEARLLLFPYYAGATFVQEVHRRGGWPAVDQLFDGRPVLSTEQVLHPQKYADEPDFPVGIEIAPGGAPGDGWTLMHEEVVGEFTTRTLIERFLSADEAAIAATGWDGDRLRVYENGGGVLAYVWVSTWDRERDAEQFATMFLRASEVRLPGAVRIDAALDQGASRAVWRTPDGGLVVQRTGRDVVVVEGFPLERARELAAGCTPFVRVPHPSDPGVPGADARSTELAEATEQASRVARREAAGESGDPQIDGNRLVDPQYGFQITRPANRRWHFIRYRPGSPQRARIQRLDDLNEDLLLANRSFTVVVVPMGLPLDLEQIAHQTERQLAFTLRNFKKLAESHIMLSGRPAIELRYRGQLGDVAMRFRQVISIHADHQYKLTAASPVGTYEEDHPDFVEIFDSFITR